MVVILASLALASPAPAPSIPLSTSTLPNGLQLTLAPDSSVPFVCVNVWYDVGSKDEVKGRSGFAHLFEHLMFNGSANADYDFFTPLQPLGAQMNGSTTLDRTNYYECVPSEQLPLALFLEADRMGWLLPALTEAKLANQKDVVRNERRQRYDNPPYGQAWIEILKGSFPEGHPYRIATIGLHEEIEAASLADVRAFFEQWYLPNNASLVITGDFDEAVTRKLVDQYFGPVKAGPEPVRTPPTQAVFEGEKRVNLTDDVAFDKVWLVWHTPKLFAPGDAELDLLSSSLTDGKDSRLYKALVHEQQIAQSVSARQSSMAYQSLYIIEATASEGHTADELVAAIDKVLDTARASGITDAELAVGKTGYEVQFFGSLTTIQGKADMLNSYITRTGQADYLATDLARYRAATVAGVNDALRTWLPPKQRLVMVIGPEKK